MPPLLDVAVIGAGPAGLSAGLYAARAGAKVVIFEKLTAGGQMLLTQKIENYPGVAGASGADLAAAMRAQAEAAGAEFVTAEVTKLQVAAAANGSVTPAEDDLATTAPADARFYLETEEGPVWARFVIAATGTTPRRLGLPQEKELTGHGVSYCVTCDGPLYAGRAVAVYGGGNSALYAALDLAEQTKQVYLIHHGPSFRGEAALQAKIAAHPKIQVLLKTEIVELKSADGELSGLGLKSDDTETPDTLEVAALFVAIGRIADTKLFPADQNADGRLQTNAQLETNISGLYAAGDVVAKPLYQIVSAAADGALAATQICQRLRTER